MKLAPVIGQQSLPGWSVLVENLGAVLRRVKGLSAIGASAQAGARIQRGRLWPGEGRRGRKRDSSSSSAARDRQRRPSGDPPKATSIPFGGNGRTAQPLQGRGRA